MTLGTMNRITASLACGVGVRRPRVSVPTSPWIGALYMQQTTETVLEDYWLHAGLVPPGYLSPSAKNHAKINQA